MGSEISRMREFLAQSTLWAPGDPILGDGQTFFVEHVRSASGQPHATFDKASHFLQEDVGEELARHMIAFIAAT